MKITAIIFLLIFTASDVPVSETVVCDAVRYYVQKFGIKAAEEWAKNHKWSAAALAGAKKCLNPPRVSP